MFGLGGTYQLEGSSPLYLSVLRLWSRDRINKSTACVIVGWCMVWLWPQTRLFFSSTSQYEQCFWGECHVLGFQAASQTEVEVWTDMECSCLTVTLTCRSQRQAGSFLHPLLQLSLGWQFQPFASPRWQTLGRGYYLLQGREPRSGELQALWFPCQLLRTCQNSPSSFSPGHSVLSERGNS